MYCSGTVVARSLQRAELPWVLSHLMSCPSASELAINQHRHGCVVLPPLQCFCRVTGAFCPQHWAQGLTDSRAGWAAAASLPVALADAAKIAGGDRCKTQTRLPGEKGGKRMI